MESTTIVDVQTEQELLRRWTGERDERARARLVASQQGLVARIARRYARGGHSIADLIQEGNLGLLHALDRFDPDRGVRLSTYATWWVRAHVLRFIEHNRGLIRGATTSGRTRLFYQLARTRQRLAAGGEEVSREAIAHALGVDVADVEAMELLGAPTTSLDAPVREGDDQSAQRMEKIASPEPGPEQRVQEAELRDQLGRALDTFERTLRGRQLEMFRDRLATSRPLSLQELGERWGITRAAARRIENQVSRPLKRHLYREIGDSITVALGPA